MPFIFGGEFVADGRVVIDTEIITKGIVDGTDDIIKACRRMAKDVDHLSENVRNSFAKQADAIQKAARAYEDSEDKIGEMNRQLEELKEQKIPTEGYKNIQKQIGDTEKKLSQLLEKQNEWDIHGAPSGRAYGELEYNIERAKQKLEKLNAEKSKMESDKTAFISGADTEKAAQLERKITSELQKQNERARSLTTSYNHLSAIVDKYSNEISEATAAAENLAQAENDMSEASKNSNQTIGGLQATLTGLKAIFNPVISTISELKTAINSASTAPEAFSNSFKILSSKATSSLKGIMTTVTKTSGIIAKGGFSRLISGLKSLSEAAKKAAKTLAQMVGRGIISGLRKISTGVFGLNKSVNKSTSGFNTSLKTLLRYGIGIESLFTLINKLRSALVEGFKNLAQYSNDTNATISGLMSSLEQCKNALATAFDPILQAVAPALNYLINLVTAAATAVAHLIAALTGKSTFIKATKVQKDYAKSLKGTGSAAKSAGEDAEGALAPFDKLNVMADEATGKGSGGGGGGAGGTLAEDMFETVPVESKFKQLADNLKKFIKSEDWKGLGAYIANGLNAGLQKIYDVISWDNVGPKITYFVNAFTETFNSIVDNLDWDLLGGTIGAGVNTVVNTLNLLIEGIDWENIGIKLSVGFRGMLNEINWTNLGNLIGNKFMITWNIFKGFVDDMWRTNNFTGLSGWNELGISLAQGFNGVFEKMDFGQIGTTLGKVITGIFQAAIDFAKTFDWKGLGENIANGINQFLENFDATTVAKGTNEVIKGLLDSLIAAIEKTDWHLMGEKLAEFLENLDWNGIADRVFEAIGAGFGGFFSFLQGLIGDAWNDVIDWWHENAYEDGEFTIQGLFDGIINKLKDIGSWIKEHIFDPFIKGFKTAFGIHSPSTVMQEMGGYLMDGLKNGISNFIPNVIQKFADLKNKIISKWDEVKQNTATKWEEIKSNLSQKWDNLKTTAGTTFNSIKQKVSEMWGNVQTDTSSKWGDIKNTLFGVWESLKDKAEKIFGKIKDAVKNTWEKIQGFDGDVGTAGRSALAAASATVRTMTPSAQPVNLPRLASGTVVPPRAGEFAAILGDNNRESEVVSPLSTMKQALKEALQESGGIGNGGEIVGYVYLDGKEMGKSVVKFIRQEKDRTGRNPVMV